MSGKRGTGLLNGVWGQSIEHISGEVEQKYCLAVSKDCFHTALLQVCGRTTGWKDTMDHDRDPMADDIFLHTNFEVACD